MEPPSTSQHLGMVSTSWIPQQDCSNDKPDPSMTVLEVWTCIKPMGFQPSTSDCWGPSLLRWCTSVRCGNTAVRCRTVAFRLPSDNIQGLLCQMTTFTLPHKRNWSLEHVCKRLGQPLTTADGLLLRTLKISNSSQTPLHRIR